MTDLTRQSRGTGAEVLRAVCRAAGDRLPPREARQIPIVNVMAICLIAICVAFVGYRFDWFAHRSFSRGAAYTDLNDFVLVGHMALNGKLAQAYSIPAMHLAQVADGSAGNFLPWAYPPVYDLVAVGLARLGLQWAFALFVGLPFFGTLWLIRRIAGSRFGPVILCAFPGFLICLICGQNGFVTADLLGAFALCSLAGSSLAGLSLGAFVIKPHLGVLIGLQTVMSRRWRVLGAAILVAGGTSAVATAVFGVQVWAWFLNAAHGAGLALAQGRYTLSFMISLYSTTRAMGLSARGALGLQILIALLAVVFTWRLIQHGRDQRITHGLILLMSLVVTPYALSYDTPILAIAGAFLVGPVLERARKWQLAVILALSWLVSGSSMFAWVYVPATTGPTHQAISFAGLAYPLLIGMVLWILRHELGPQCGTPRSGLSWFDAGRRPA